MFRDFVKPPAWIMAALGLALSAGVHAAVAPLAPRITQVIDETQRTKLPGHVHAALRDSRDTGAADPALRADRLTLVLRASAAQEADLEQFLAQLQTPGHGNFHRWLTPQDFEQRFGVHPADLRKLRGWLQAQGFRIDAVPAGGRAIVFSGTIGQVNAAFGAAIRRYEWHGERHLAASVEPSVPSALAPVVRGFATLHDFRRHAALVPARSAPDFTSGASNYLAPGDYQAVYDLSASYARGISGTGRSIAVLGRSSVLAADLANFRSFSGLPANPPQVINNGTAPALVSGDELESDLDLEWSAAVARTATIKFVTSASTTLSDGIDLSAQYAVSNNVADIISLSYSACESTADVGAGLPYYHQLWQQAAAQGISVFVASGDWGAAGCDSTPGETVATQGLAVNQLCSSPYSTCVGGTEFSADVGNAAPYWSATNSSANASALGYIGESVWNQSAATSTLDASGGGASLYFAKPAWQYATGVPSDGRRDVPDLALAASSVHDAYLMYTSDGQSASTLVAVGGTSAAAPSMAGLLALVAQQQGGRLGNVNPALYALSNLQDAGGGAVFHRITAGNNSVPGQGGFSASTGDPSYNQATGLGSVDGGALLANWSAYAIPASGLVPASALIPATTFVGTAHLTVPAATAWTASVGTPATSWLSVSPASGSGPTGLSFVAQANSGAQRNGTITVAGMSLAVTQASGVANAAAHLAVSPTSLAFGNASVGNFAASQRILIGNAGNVALGLSALALGGAQPGDFGFSGSCSSGLSLAGGASCYLDVAFTPTATGARSATLQVTAGSQATTLALTGNGLMAPANLTDGEVPFPAWAEVLLALLLLSTARKAGRWSTSGRRFSGNK